MAKAAANTRKPRKPELPPKNGMLSQPLDTLIFLLPWLLFYSVSLLLIAPDGSPDAGGQIVSFHLVEAILAMFGTTGFFMPLLLVVAILLVAHIHSKASWKPSWSSIMQMYGESMVLSVPLLLLNFAFRHPSMLAATDGGVFMDVTLCIGAGIYEELVFRLIGISILIIIGVDLLKLPREATLIAGVMITATLFAAHHHPPLGTEAFNLYRFLFRVAAGTYLGGVYVFRGYGPAAGAHIAYNLMVTAIGH